jgi:hypothetical protein
MNEGKKSGKTKDITAATLHILAMVFMLMDHMWATVFPAQSWLTCVGRLAYPIFAFLVVEGYFHTHSFRCYLLRLLLFAAISEFPFDLMYDGSMFYPFHQNVLWTFLIALLCIRLMELLRDKYNRWVYGIGCVAISFLGYLLGTLGMVDYYGSGILIVLVFYFFRRRRWYCLLGQIITLSYINIWMLQGRYYPITISGRTFDFYQQSLALLALIPIWLYHGRQGHHSKGFQYTCYAFYPFHMLVLALLSIIAMG